MDYKTHNININTKVKEAEDLDNINILESKYSEFIPYYISSVIYRNEC